MATAWITVTRSTQRPGKRKPVPGIVWCATRLGCRPVCAKLGNTHLFTGFKAATGKHNRRRMNTLSLTTGILNLHACYVALL